jgi:hypothetical protein
MTLKETIRKILREENEKTPKSKLINLLEKPNGLVNLLNGGFTIKDITNITEMSKKEIYQKFNPFEFIDKMYKESIKNTILERIGRNNWTQSRKNKTEDEIIKELISYGIDDVHYDIMNWDTGDWIVPNTPKLLELIYTDWIKQQEIYKRLMLIIRFK